MAMDKPTVVKLCEKNAVNPVVRDIMVERIMMHESEGEAAIAMGDAEPAARGEESRPDSFELSSDLHAEHVISKNCISLLALCLCQVGIPRRETVQAPFTKTMSACWVYM